MIRHKLKKICVIISLICIIASMVAVYSSAVDPLTFSAMSAAADAFGMQYGVGTTYSVANAAGVDSSFQDMWDEFQTYQTNQGDSYNYQDYYKNFNDKEVIQSFTHSSGKFSGFHFDQTDITVFTKFWRWLLSGPAGMQEVDNQYQWQRDQLGNINPIQVANYQYAMINGYLLYPTPILRQLSDGTQQTFYTSVNDTYGVVVHSPGSTNKYCVVVSLSSTTFQYWLDNGSKSYSSTDSGWKYVAMQAGNGGSFPNISVEYETAYHDPGRLFGNYDGTNISTGSDALSIEPYKNAEVISLPDISDPTNIEPVDIITNIPWDDSYDQQEDQNGNPIPLPATDVPNIVNEWIDSVHDNTLELEEAENEDPQPPANEVYIPFLPVELPSFNFSFSGIWHYVREWVSSLGSFFTTLFAIWSALPYAMVVPVYATAVVVIVLGVYKRFFM